jgi:PAS domain S-box-containing protein
MNVPRRRVVGKTAPRSHRETVGPMRPGFAPAGPEPASAQTLAAEKFRRGFDASRTPISIVALRDARFLDVNEAFLRITGFSRAEVIGRTPLQLRFWTRMELSSFVRKLKRNESLRDLEIPFRTKAGDRRVGLHSAEIVELDDQRCSLNLMRDITEQRAPDKRLRQARKSKLWEVFSKGTAAGH